MNPKRNNKEITELSPLKQACLSIISLNTTIEDRKKARQTILDQAIAKYGSKEFQKMFDEIEVEEFVKDPAWNHMGRGEMK